MITHKKTKDAQRKVRRSAVKPPTGEVSNELRKDTHEEKEDPHNTRIPKALVVRLHGLTKKMLVGRGFSPLELNNVGLNSVTARRLGLRVDTKRKSKHPENVEQLKSLHPL